jgi:hypothetical protein
VDVLFNRFGEVFLDLSGRKSAWASSSRSLVDIIKGQNFGSTRDIFKEGAAYVRHGDLCAILIRKSHWYVERTGLGLGLVLRCRAMKRMTSNTKKLRPYNLRVMNSWKISGQGL